MVPTLFSCSVTLDAEIRQRGESMANAACELGEGASALDVLELDACATPRRMRYSYSDSAGHEARPHTQHTTHCNLAALGAWLGHVPSRAVRACLVCWVFRDDCPWFSTWALCNAIFLSSQHA